MSDESYNELWICTEAGTVKFRYHESWEKLFSTIVSEGWRAPSSGQIGWLHSRLVPNTLSSFFTMEDAASFALALETHIEAMQDKVDAENLVVIRNIANRFRMGPTFVWPAPGERNLRSDAIEVLYVYACSKCGFIGQGTLKYDEEDYGLEDAKASAKSILEHIYCPLCGSRDIVCAVFPITPLDQT